MFNNNNKTIEKKSAVEMVNSTNVISKETKIVGDINAAGNIRIEGHLEGIVQSKTKIVIGDSAIIKGNLSSPDAEISGKVEGEVHCSGTLYLNKSAIVTGNITTQKLVVENGAVFNGKCQMTSSTQSLVVSKSNQSEEQPKKQIASL
ncbi:bactofilin family protein [Aquiflexum lacus]|uniref:bactofilin family protein n=1 Tax=Aquiflexum lacus TaxID=2483805 RepID=UPI001894BD66|nr:polymer-forming cytoskeletal protein [Aquiflexum lacus]